jgi:hypothetical protein
MNAATSTQLYSHLNGSPKLTLQPSLNKPRRIQGLLSNSARLQKEQELRQLLKQQLQLSDNRVLIGMMVIVVQHVYCCVSGAVS